MPFDAAPPITLIERTERALVLLAYLIELDGDTFVAMYEQTERELEELKSKEDTKARARSRLSAYVGKDELNHARSPIALTRSAKDTSV
jgi:hypothetical protein